MILKDVIKSPVKNKKFRAVFIDSSSNAKGGKTINVDFGDSRYQDYTQHHDPERRRLYRIRHAKDLETNNVRSPGYLSYYILWGDSTDINQNIADYKRKFLK